MPFCVTFSGTFGGGSFRGCTVCLLLGPSGIALGLGRGAICDDGELSLLDLNFSSVSSEM
jgi:hypothetical protein